MPKLLQIPPERKKSVSNIGGPVRYDLLAQLNRPSDPQALQAEVMRLRRNGLRPVDISFHLRMNLPHVMEMLRESHEG